VGANPEAKSVVSAEATGHQDYVEKEKSFARLQGRAEERAKGWGRSRSRNKFWDQSVNRKNRQESSFSGKDIRFAPSGEGFLMVTIDEPSIPNTLSLSSVEL
jgi:hypothetical protein